MRVLVARLEVLGEMDRRGSIRFTIDGDSTLRDMEGRPFDVHVEDLSRTGLLFASAQVFPVGTVISIGLSGGGTHEAKVVWQQGERHGCEFFMPLPRSKMERAFQGQAAVLAEIEAALTGRVDAGFEDEPDPEPPVRGLRARLAAFFGRRSPDL
ncbi:PilZ domain-containing protein [Sphingomonas sp. MMS12-HWE2-04]|uniref:PilZ domain-containing protein n=1 Tax=Sphingomonas sp. MMS12-HWE2-04 TaxID=3234199 RepID=UPI0038504D92